MSKFRVNDSVRSDKFGQGVVKAREVNHVNGRTDVKYLVDFGGGIENWKVVTRSDVRKVVKEESKPNFKVKTYKIDGDKKVLTLASHVTSTKYFPIYDEFGDVYDFMQTNGKTLKIGFSLYNGSDDYDEKIGRKYAIHRCKNNPFATMFSSFYGEFNEETVDAVMDAKAKYIIKNIDNFYRPKE